MTVIAIKQNRMSPKRQPEANTSCNSMRAMCAALKVMEIR